MEQRCCQTSSLRTHLPESDGSIIGAFLGDRQHVDGEGVVSQLAALPYHQVLLTRLGPLGPHVEIKQPQFGYECRILVSLPLVLFDIPNPETWSEI